MHVRAEALPSHKRWIALIMLAVLAFSTSLSIAVARSMAGPTVNPPASVTVQAPR